YSVLSHPRAGLHFLWKQILRRHPPRGDALVVAITAEGLQRWAARLDAVGEGVLALRLHDLVRDGGDPRERRPRNGEIAQPLEAAPLGFIEGLVEVHRDPRMLLERSAPKRDEMHDREDAGLLKEALFLGAVVGEQSHHLAVTFNECIGRARRDCRV